MALDTYGNNIIPMKEKNGVAIVTNVIPNTGVPLPFISYGGTSMVFLLAEMGIALGVSRHIVPISKRQGKGVIEAV